LQKQVTRLTEKMSRADSEHERLLKDHAAASAAQGRAMETMRQELEAARQLQLNSHNTATAVEESKEQLLADLQQENATLMASLKAAQEQLHVC
jgi:hypothetical protein